MWQSLVMTDQASSEIRQQIRHSKTEWLARLAWLQSGRNKFDIQHVYAIHNVTNDACNGLTLQIIMLTNYRTP